MDFAIQLLRQLFENSSAGIGGYESPASVSVKKPSLAKFIERRYGCDKRPNHHSRARCRIEGRLSELKLALQKTPDIMERLKYQKQIHTWSRKLRDEIRRSRYRKKD